MQDRVGNITVLFSHCFKKKGALQESINREIRTLSCDKTVNLLRSRYSGRHTMLLPTLVGEERYVTTLITAANETIRQSNFVLPNSHI